MLSFLLSVLNLAVLPLGLVWLELTGIVVALVVTVHICAFRWIGSTFFCGGGGEAIFKASVRSLSLSFLSPSLKKKKSFFLSSVMVGNGGIVGLETTT